MHAPLQKSEHRFLTGDCIAHLKTMRDNSIDCVVTSPPYFGLRDYGVDGQIGLEQTPTDFVNKLVEVFREVRRVLKPSGTCWLNLGDSYAGSWGAQSRSNGNDKKSTLGGGSMLSARQIQAHPKTTLTGSLKNTPGLKPKDLIGIPWRVAFALQSDGWYLRQDIIWHKPNPMPESVRDRCTKAHEYLFMLTKSEKYFYDADAVAEPSVMRPQNRNTKRIDHPKGDEGRPLHRRPEGGIGGETRNRRSVWTITPKPFKEAHFATFPPDLVEPCVLAGCPVNGIVLDPFSGAGTTVLVATRLNRHAIGIELNPAYNEIAERRLAKEPSPSRDVPPQP